MSKANSQEAVDALLDKVNELSHTLSIRNAQLAEALKAAELTKFYKEKAEAWEYRWSQARLQAEGITGITIIELP